MPKRALPKPPRIPKTDPIERPPQLNAPDEVSRPKPLDRAELRLSRRPKRDDSLRGQPGGPFISPYMHKQRQDPSRQNREDSEQFRELQELNKQKKEIDDKINEIRNRDTRINPYNVNKHVSETVNSIIADLRNMEQAPWSGNLDGFYEYSPLHSLFKNQFSISEEENEEEK